MSKQATSVKKTPGGAPEQGRIESLIDLAANLSDPLHYQAIGKLSMIVEELRSINATRTNQLPGSRALRRTLSERLGNSRVKLCDDPRGKEESNL